MKGILTAILVVVILIYFEVCDIRKNTKKE